MYIFYAAIRSVYQTVPWWSTMMVQISTFLKLLPFGKLTCQWKSLIYVHFPVPCLFARIRPPIRVILLSFPTVAFHRLWKRWKKLEKTKAKQHLSKILPSRTWKGIQRNRVLHLVTWRFFLFVFRSHFYQSSLKKIQSEPGRRKDLPKLSWIGKCFSVWSFRFFVPGEHSVGVQHCLGNFAQ